MIDPCGGPALELTVTVMYALARYGIEVSVITTARFTGTGLTVIAVALSVIAVRGSIVPAKAQSDGPMHVIVDQIGSSLASLPLQVQVQQ